MELGQSFTLSLAPPGGCCRRAELLGAGVTLHWALSVS